MCSKFDEFRPSLCDFSCLITQGKFGYFNTINVGRISDLVVAMAVFVFAEIGFTCKSILLGRKQLFQGQVEILGINNCDINFFELSYL